MEPCVEECPEEAIILDDVEIAYVDCKKCTECGTCVEVCPSEAIRIDSESIQPQEISTHPAFKIRHTLVGHECAVFGMAISPDGHVLASTSADRTIRLWDLDRWHQMKVIEHFNNSSICVAWSPDGQTIASGDGLPQRENMNVYLWNPNAKTAKLSKTLEGHIAVILSIAWSPDGTILASGSEDATIILWDTRNGQVIRSLQAAVPVHSLAWSPDGERLCSISTAERTSNLTSVIKVWDVQTGEIVKTLEGASNIKYVAWSQDGRYIASASGDRESTIYIWDTEAGRETNILEAHTGGVVSIVFLDDGRLLASLDANGALAIWRAGTWEKVVHMDKIGASGDFATIAIHPTYSTMCVCAENRKEINIWDLDLDLIRGSVTAIPAVNYINAKAVLLGDSRVGKSGLGIRIAEKVFRETDSTHGAQFWNIPVDQLSGLSSDLQAELTLWDLAGQPEYRLVHQLFLDDTNAALLLFDCSDPYDPFHGVQYWAKVLQKRLPSHAVKFLVSSRCDEHPVTVKRPQINEMLANMDWMSILKQAQR